MDAKVRREKAKATQEELELGKKTGTILSIVEYRLAVERLIDSLNEIFHDLESQYPDSQAHVAKARKRISEIKI